MPPASSYPSSTATLCVLPLRTNGEARFSVAAGAMPAALAGRMVDADFHALAEHVNTVLYPLAHFDFLSLILPFILVDLLTMALLCTVDPWLLVTPWDYDLAGAPPPHGARPCARRRLTATPPRRLARSRHARVCAHFSRCPAPAPCAPTARLTLRCVARQFSRSWRSW